MSQQRIHQKMAARAAMNSPWICTQRCLTALSDADTVQGVSSTIQGARVILKGIDHLVVVVPELDAAVASYRGLGFTAVPGGRHPTGTHNALIAFADGSYLELIAFYEPNAQHRWYQRLQQGGGLIDYCLQTDDLADDVRRFRAAGVERSPHKRCRARPRPGRRRRVGRHLT